MLFVTHAKLAHATLARRTGTRCTSRTAHSCWQRGTNENTNGLVRQYLSKGADLTIFSQRDFDSIAFALNVRPRKSLSLKPPNRYRLNEPTEKTALDLVPPPSLDALRHLVNFRFEFD